MLLAAEVYMWRYGMQQAICAKLHHQNTTRCQVSGIYMQSRADGSARSLDIDGVFVEVGLLPNTAFVMDVLALNEQGEIIVDCQTNTSIAGSHVFVGAHRGRYPNLHPNTLRRRIKSWVSNAPATTSRSRAILAARRQARP